MTPPRIESQRPLVLFVDDDQSVLDGLYRSLSASEDGFDMLFTGSGAAALEIVGARRVDVIVTDLKMPKMGGVDLLEKVRHISPETTRIVLSACSEREVPYQTVGPAHQYYTKPCSSAKLAAAINRALAVRRRLQAPELLAVISGTKAMPALPQALVDLLDEIQSPQGSAAGVARIIGSDVGLTVQLLKLANSGFFRVASPITDVTHAVRLLGFETIRSLVVLGNLFGTFRSSGGNLDLAARLQGRSLLIGQVARRIAVSEAMEQAAIEQAQCAGMLAHVGSLILLMSLPEQFRSISRELDRAGGTVTDVERTHLGVTHADCGAALLDLWGFPGPIVEAVLFHHEPGLCDGGGPGLAASGGAALTAVHAAQALLKPPRKEAGGGKARTAGLDLDYLTRRGVADHIPAWAKIADSLAGQAPQLSATII
jgi:HD-like signal output (HDOD) protein/CheY-like chemotaxis protein